MKTTTVDFELEDTELAMIASEADKLSMTLSGYFNYILLSEVVKVQKEEIEELKVALEKRPVSGFHAIKDLGGLTLGLLQDTNITHWLYEDDEWPSFWTPLYIRDTDDD